MRAIVPQCALCSPFPQSIQGVIKPGVVSNRERGSQCAPLSQSIGEAARTLSQGAPLSPIASGCAMTVDALCRGFATQQPIAVIMSRHLTTPGDTITWRRAFFRALTCTLDASYVGKARRQGGWRRAPWRRAWRRWGAKSELVTPPANSRQLKKSRRVTGL